MTTFELQVDAWVLAGIRVGPSSFDDLLCMLPGVYPTDVRASLDRLHVRAAISCGELQRALRRQPRRPIPLNSSVLPVPHPLDFDWRFSSDAVDVLIDAWTGLGSDDDCVVCIGAPSVHERLARANSWPSILIDANDEIVAALAFVAPGSAIRARVGCDPLPTLTAGVVVIDPPWYPEHVRLFLWAAARLCADDGIVLLSLPPAGTRPGVAEERDDAVCYASHIGLSLLEIRHGDLAYRSPPFERLALVAAGYANLPEDWRRGDLLVFRAQADHGVEDGPGPVVDDAAWVSIPVSPTRVKVRRCQRRDRAAPVRPRMYGIVAGDVLPTVSRREPRRALASVWTACNRVFGCVDTNSLATIAHARTAKGDAVLAVAEEIRRRLAPDEESEVRSTLEQLDELLAVETRDLKECRWPAHRP